MDGVNTKNGHPLHDTWRWIIRNHARNGMVCERWLDFWNFAEDIKQKPVSETEKVHFHRHYFDKPYGPKNWRWRIFAKNDETRRKKALYAKHYRAKKLLEDPDYHKNFDLMGTYGIGIKEYREMLAKQDGVCAICKGKEESISQHSKSKRRYAVDHCHKTGKIRGILCSHCNLGLGSFKDDVERLKSAIRYLGGSLE